MTALHVVRRDLVLANHILAQESVLDAFGHVSTRHPETPHHFLLARAMAPMQVSDADILTFNLNAEVIDGAGAPYLERFLHSSIYAARPDVNAIVHSHAHDFIPFGTAGVAVQPMFHMAGFLGGPIPTFDIRDVFGHTNLLIQDTNRGAALAEMLGVHCAALMRGHGAVVVGQSVKQAVYRAIYLNINARLQAEALRLGGDVRFLSQEEAALAAEANDTQLERPWHLWIERLSS